MPDETDLPTHYTVELVASQLLACTTDHVKRLLELGELKAWDAKADTVDGDSARKYANELTSYDVSMLLGPSPTPGQGGAVRSILSGAAISKYIGKGIAQPPVVIEWRPGVPAETIAASKKFEAAQAQGCQFFLPPRRSVPSGPRGLWGGQPISTFDPHPSRGPREAVGAYLDRVPVERILGRLPRLKLPARKVPVGPFGEWRIDRADFVTWAHAVGLKLARKMPPLIS